MSPEPPPPPPSIVEMARMDLGGSYFRGARLVGHGTRAPVQGTVGTLRLDVLRFPLSWLGFEIGFWIGPAAASIDARADGGLGGAFDVAPLRWSGPWPGSLILGAGAAFGTVRPVWLDAEVHAYPTIHARARLFPGPTIGLHAAWRFTPITTDDLTVRAHDIELAASAGLVQVGARARLDAATGGDPERTYSGLWIGPFIGIAVY